MLYLVYTSIPKYTRESNKLTAKITSYGKDYRKKKKENGYCFTKVVVPKEYRYLILEYARKLREHYEYGQDAER
jgi:hypothetical protein